MISDIQDQSQTLSRNTLFTTLACLTTSLFVSFLDQTAVTTAIPSISRSLHDASLINTWCGTSYLISNTTFQLQFGRLSDIFGRKTIFLISIGCLFIGNLISGFAKSSIMLFVFRAISGIGGGGINCLVMITFSDLLTPRERGKYFGFVAISTSLGNGMGPLIGGVLSERASWKWTFWISCPIAIFCASLIFFLVPFKPVNGTFKTKVKQLDFSGFLTSLIGIVFILIAISGGGETWSWGSPRVLCLLIIGICSSIIFLLIEIFYAKIPMIPLNLFNNIHRSLLFLMCLLMGWAYFVDIYYYPIYLQNIRNWSPIISGVIQLPATCSSSIFGVGVGFINSKTGNYVTCLWFGGAMWCLGTGLKILFDLNSNIGLLIGSNLIQGLGIAFTFQPTLLALLSYSAPNDRAVVTGLRNFFRCFGGAVGLIISGIIFNTSFKKKLNNIIDDDEIIRQIISNPKLLTTYGDKVVDAYLESYRDIMISLTVLSGIMLLISLSIRNKSELNNNKLEIKENENMQEKQESIESIVNIK